MLTIDRHKVPNVLGRSWRQSQLAFADTVGIHSSQYLGMENGLVVSDLFNTN